MKRGGVTGRDRGSTKRQRVTWREGEVDRETEREGGRQEDREVGGHKERGQQGQRKRERWRRGDTLYFYKLYQTFLF